MKLLAVDWDYFCPTGEPGNPDAKREETYLYDWGHSERWAFMADGIWAVRAAGFKKNGLPLPTTSGLENGFWDRFRIDPKATLWYSDSNVGAAHPDVMEGIDEVYLYDAHHDSGYGKRLVDIMKSGQVSCEDWMVAYYLQNPVTKLRVRYPYWRRDAFKVEPKPAIKVHRRVDDGKPLKSKKFDRVYVCRSPSWTPTWEDEKFFQLINSCPAFKKAPIHPLMERTWNPADVDQHISTMKEVMGGFR